MNAEDRGRYHVDTMLVCNDEVTSKNKVQGIPKEMVIELSQISDPFWLSLFPL